MTYMDDPLPSVFDRQFDWTKLRIANAGSSGDPNGIEVVGSEFVDTANGLTGTISGGLACADPDTGLWWSWPFTDIFNRPLLSTNYCDPRFMLRELVPPALNSDVYWTLGIGDEANIASATFNGWATTYLFTGGARIVGYSYCKGGAWSLGQDLGPVSTFRRATISTNRWYRLYDFTQLMSAGWDDAGQSTGDIIWVNSPNITFSAIPLQMHAFLSVGRTTAAAGDATFSFCPFEKPTIKLQSERAPT